MPFATLEDSRGRLRQEPLGGKNPYLNDYSYQGLPLISNFWLTIAEKFRNPVESAKLVSAFLDKIIELEG